MTIFLTLGGIILLYCIISLFMYAKFYWCRFSHLSALSKDLNEDNLTSINADAYFHLGVFFNNKSIFDKAVANYAKAIELDPSHILAHKFLKIAMLKKLVPQLQPAQDDTTAANEQEYLAHIKSSSTTKVNIAKEAVINSNLQVEKKSVINHSDPNPSPENPPPQTEEQVDTISLSDLSITELPTFTKAEKIKATTTNNKNSSQDNSTPDTYFKRAETHFENKRFDEAIADYSKAIESNPSHGQAYCKRGQANIQIVLYLDAIADFDKAIELMPHEIDSYLYRGKANSQRGKRLEAISDFSKIIEIDADNDIAYYNRGLEFQNLGEYDTALINLDKACKLGNNSACIATISLIKEIEEIESYNE